MTWSEFGFWLLTSFSGAGLVKLLDLVAHNYTERKTQKKSKVAILLAHIKDYEELEDLYGFVSRFETHALMDESGEFKRDTSGNLIYEDQILEPESRFNEALKSMNGTDFNAAITNKIIKIRLAASEAGDIALELDPSGSLKHQLNDLYAKTIWSIELILKEKTLQNQRNKFIEMVKALKAAEETRRNLRTYLQRYLN